MSDVEARPSETVCGGLRDVTARPVRELLHGREVVLGVRGMAVTRTLPHRDRRMVGAWCFVDRYGPARPAMRIGPHPHTGLQTVSWLVAGEILHRDSLGSLQSVRPGRLGLMTAGRAIAHAEESAQGPVLHGVQLWVALPDRHRHVEPHFEHHADLPVRRDAGTTVTVFMGELGDAASPARTYSPLVGADVALDPGASTRLPLRPEFEYAVLVVSGSVEVDGVALDAGPLLYLGCGRSALPVSAAGPARLLLLGGEPFEERIVMWWNFVARGHDEIVQAREDWAAGRRFGTVHGYDGEPLPAPPMPLTRLVARGRAPDA